MTTPAPGHDTVLVLDFGAQYAQLIARRVRECHVFSEVVPCDIDPATVRAHDARALILSGGPRSVYEPGAPALDPRLLELGIPVLGLCYGQQAMARVLGGRVLGEDLRRRHGVGDDLAVDARLADAPGDELGVLGAEVDDQDGAVGAGRAHRSATTSAFWNSFTVS